MVHFQLFDLYTFFLLLLLFFLQDIYYANNKELIKKKLLTKFQTTLLTEGEKWGKVLYDTYIRYSQKTAAQFLNSGLFYK